MSNSIVKSSRVAEACAAFIAHHKARDLHALAQQNKCVEALIDKAMSRFWFPPKTRSAASDEIRQSLWWDLSEHPTRSSSGRVRVGKVAALAKVSLDSCSEAYLKLGAEDAWLLAPFWPEPESPPGDEATEAPVSAANEWPNLRAVH